MTIKIVFLTSADAAKILGITPDAVRDHERRGNLPALKTTGGQRIFLLGDVERFAVERLLRRERRRAKVAKAAP